MNNPVNFFYSKYSNSELVSLNIPSSIFIDSSSDYDNNHTNFDTILYLPSSGVIEQIQNHQDITGIVFSTPNIEYIRKILESDLSTVKEEIESKSFKRMSNEAKELAVSVIKKITDQGFMISVSIPSYLFDHCDKSKKTSGFYYTITNCLLRYVFQEKHKANIKKISVFVFSRGEYNNGLKSRISRLSKENLTSEVEVINSYLNPQGINDDLLLEKFLGLSCWFITQQKSPQDAKWFQLIKN